VHRRWHSDGPLVKAEFLRQSSNGRLTLVLDASAAPVRSLWALFDGSDLDVAKEALRAREGIPKGNAQTHVQSWSRGEAPPPHVVEPEDWASARGVRALVWTALPPKFGSEDRAPTIEEAVSYLSSLSGAT